MLLKYKMSSLLFDYYPCYMLLKLYISNPSLKLKYVDEVNSHNLKIIHNPKYIDAGFDIYVPEKITCSSANKINKIYHGIKCSATVMSGPSKYDTGNYSVMCEAIKFNTGYYMHPRSSIYKTPLRLANSTGIIDAGYRGNLIGMFDCSAEEHVIEQYDRLLQICAPSLMPVFVEIVETEEELGEQTQRGEGGFGSTGK